MPLRITRAPFRDYGRQGVDPFFLFRIHLMELRRERDPDPLIDYRLVYHGFLLFRLLWVYRLKLPPVFP